MLVVDARQVVTVSVDDQRALRADATLELGDLAPGRLDPFTTLSVLAEPLDQPPTTADSPATGAPPASGDSPAPGAPSATGAPPASNQRPAARWRALRLLGVFPPSSEGTARPQRDDPSPSSDRASARDSVSPACET